VIGGGVVGLSLAWELRKNGADVLVLERGRLGGEASSAAGGMLAWCDPHLGIEVRKLALLSAGCYGEFVSEIERASGIAVDLRKQGTIAIGEGASAAFHEQCRRLLASEFLVQEPGLAPSIRDAQWWPEWSVDPRRLMTSLEEACRKYSVHVREGEAAISIVSASGRAHGVRTLHHEYLAQAVVNCAGAWAGEVACGLSPCPTPTRPVKGQLFSVEAAGILQHVIRSPQVYLIPRSDGTVVVGATVEEAGYNKGTNPEAIEGLRQAAARLVPDLAEKSIGHAWAGLRPASADGLPILGETSLPGYFVATGHFRDGILLAPATARVMSACVCGHPVSSDLSALSPSRFAASAVA
jgi:glycine oxidase